MSAWAKILIALAATVLGFALVAAWVFAWPWRMAARACGLSSPRRSNKGLIAVAGEATLALALSAFGLHRQGKRIGPSWHPCEECGNPIDRPSRAAYCSQACRRQANIRHRAALELDAPPF